MLWHTKQVFGHNTWWNQHRWNIRGPVQNMSKGQQTILYTGHTTSTTHQPINLCISSVCQVQGQFPEKMFPTNQEGQWCQHTNIHSSKCLDNYLINNSSSFWNHTPLHPEPPHHRHPYIYFNYNQHAAPHHSIFTCHHTMNQLGYYKHLTEHIKS